MTNLKVAVIDYGMGNVWSVLSALRFLGVEAKLVNDPEDLLKYSCMILPGVGSFRRAMESIRERKLEDAIHTAVNERGAKILGICLGMQLLGTHSSEDGKSSGLGLIDVDVQIFDDEELQGNKIPHVGFNQIQFSDNAGFFAGLPEKADFYFVHSFRMMPNENAVDRYATCHYGIEFMAAFEVGNIYGAQFHPEKSQTNGLIMLKNFLEGAESC
ncbi:imidazole glycerol phosphate synthase subunit HisH [Terasakiella sp.]|uniref:imidazole glycerol phosphate synthase subunit HisH n=1 Tax=Terasakiella sp. TaxID=2034861 RepID=UPI003AA80DBB